MDCVCSVLSMDLSPFADKTCTVLCCIRTERRCRVQILQAAQTGNHCYEEVTLKLSNVLHNPLVCGCGLPVAVVIHDRHCAHDLNAMDWYDL